MCSCAPPFCGSYVEDVNVISVVDTAASPGMCGGGKVFSQAPPLLSGMDAWLCQSHNRRTNRVGDANKAGASFELVQMTPESILQENLI